MKVEQRSIGMNELKKFSDAALRAELKRRYKTKKYYLAYRKGSRTVWGTGRSKSTARKDANMWIKDFYSHESETAAKERKKVVTVECTKEVYKDIRNFGGDHVPFVIRKGVASFKKGYGGRSY